MSTTAPPLGPPPSIPEPTPPSEPPGGVRGLVTPHVGGFLTSVATTILAFLIAGLVVLATGHNPLQVYKGIFEGSGLNWILPVGHGGRPRGRGVQPPADPPADAGRSS